MAREGRSAIVDLEICRDPGTLRESAKSRTSHILIDYSGKSAAVDNGWPSFEAWAKEYHTNGLLLLLIPEDSLYDTNGLENTSRGSM